MTRPDEDPPEWAKERARELMATEGDEAVADPDVAADDRVPDVPVEAVDEAERLTRLAREAESAEPTPEIEEAAAFYRERRDELAADHGYVPRVRERDDTLVLYPEAWMDGDTVRVDRVEDTDRAVEVSLSGPGDAGRYREVAAYNDAVAEAVAEREAAVHARIAEILDDRGIPAAKGDEGAWAPPISDAEAFEIVSEAVDDVESELGFEIGFGLDMAAAELYDAEADAYVYGDRTRSTAEQVDYVVGMVDEYDLVYVEDPLDENDYEGFAELTERVGGGASAPGASGRGPRADRTLICGDDLFVTNVERLQAGIDEEAGNAILIKPNQIGTLSDAVDAVELATENGYRTVISHRSGETEDTTIAHLAVATDAEFIKTGTVGGERTAKLNELIRIADDAV